MEPDLPITSATQEVADTEPTPAPPGAPDHALWDEGSGTSLSNPNHTSAKIWVAACVGMVAVGAAAAFGVHSAYHPTSAPTLAAASGNGGPAPGAPGDGGPGDGRPGGGAFGSIATIDGSKLTITRADGQATTVLTTASTAVTASSTGSLVDLSPGDNVTVMGTASTGGVDAQRITDSGAVAPASDGPGEPPDGPPGNPPIGGQVAPAGVAPGAGAGGGANPATGGVGRSRPSVNDGRRPIRGTVMGLDGSTLTIRTTEGAAVKVTTSPSTAVVVVRNTTLQALLVGQQVQVIGTTRSDGAITAARIRQGAADFGPPPVAGGGVATPGG